ncbi:MAG: outer membrane lipoprotein carrier protein LolA [Phycisphaerae bacterium]|nr:outer membrane lipoprotein carrier protein LolA [Phycisphaerae bacterium]
MLKRLGMMCAVAACLMGTLTAAADDNELDKIQQRLADSWKEHRSFTASMKITEKRETPGYPAATLTGTGKMELMRKGDKELMRVEVEMTIAQKLGDNETEMKQSSLTISDGDHRYVLAEMMGQKMARKTKIDKADAIDPAAMFKDLREDFELKVLSEETIGDTKVTVIEGTPKQADAAPLTRIVNYLDLEHGVMVKSVMFGQDNTPIRTTEFTDLKYDVKIDPERFVFKTPEGVELIDDTETP